MMEKLVLGAGMEQCWFAELGCANVEWPCRTGPGQLTK